MRRAITGSVIAGLALTGLVVVAEPAPAAVARCAGHRATIIGTNRTETLRGTTRADVIVAKGGNDRILGRGGADIICGGLGNDTISGDAGGDRIYGETGSDVINTGTGNDIVVAGTGNDRVNAGDGNDRVTGGDGNDSLSAAGGYDTVNAGAGNDTVTGGTGDDTLTGSTGDDKLSDTGGTNAIDAGDGNDTVAGGPNYDQVTGGDGSDILRGGDGGDTISGGLGTDALLGMGGDDSIDGGDGRDIVGYTDATGGVEVDLSIGYGVGPGVGYDDLTSVESILASRFADDLTGSEAGDVLFGNAGDDTIDGGDGNDFVLFAAATDGVIVELNVGASTAPGEGADTLANIESALGTEFDDVFYGNGADNYFDGLEGADSAYGFGGVNVCYAEQTSLCGTVLPTTDTQPGDVEGAGALAGTVTGKAAPDASKVAGPAGTTNTAPPTPPATTAPTPPPAKAPVRRDDPGPTAAALDRQVAPTSVGTGCCLECPPLYGAVLHYPDWSGYGYWAWRTTSPYTGAWTFGPWMYNSGNSSWVAYQNGFWQNVTNYTTWIGYDHTFYEAWYWDFEDQHWWFLGECKTEMPFLGYTIGELNDPGCGYYTCGPNLPLDRTTARRTQRRRKLARQGR